MSKFIKQILKYALIALPWILVSASIILAYYYHDLPSIESLESNNKNKTIEVQYSNGKKITTIGDVYDNQIIYSQIPQHLINAVIATEDRRFFTNKGFDIVGIARAFIANLKAGRIVQGGSTITQQLAKLLYFDSKKTIKRKVQEILLAIKLERIFSKEQILSLYLNRAYFGSGNYGIASASKYYFNKDISQLNLKESAMLAGLLKAPSRLSPNKNKDLAQGRANQVLKNMINAGYLEENTNLIQSNLDYKTDRMQRLYFADYATEDFDYYLDDKYKNHNRFTLKTTLDQKIQNITEDIIDSYFKKYPDRLGKNQIAVIIMSKDGAIKAMIGGKNYQQSPFNRAIYAKRQPGSIFKTFIYLQALNEGFNSEDIFIDQLIELGNWQPKNYNDQYYGEVTLQNAFALSLNSVAVQLYQNINKDGLVKNSRKMGVFTNIDKHDPTTALGTMQTTLLELVSAFAVIANNGQGIMPHHVISVADKQNNIIYERSSSGLGQIIDGHPILKLKDMLRQAVENGTARRANIDYDIYGKTGTTQNYQDAWFVGFDSSYIAGIWIGNDDNSPTNNISGGTLPAQIFADIMSVI